MKLEIFTDGGCSGNPGEAAIGVVIKKGTKTVKTLSRAIGQGTNNTAEYTALIVALQEALILKADEVSVKTDSELMCKQVTGAYAVKHENIKPLFDQVRHLVTGFRSFQIAHVPREQNSEADALVRQVFKKAGQDGRSDAHGVGEESPSSKG
jgi:ribonuclease HI